MLCYVAILTCSYLHGCTKLVVIHTTHLVECRVCGDVCPLSLNDVCQVEAALFRPKLALLEGKLKALLHVVIRLIRAENVHLEGGKMR